MCIQFASKKASKVGRSHLDLLLCWASWDITPQSVGHLLRDNELGSPYLWTLVHLTQIRGELC